MLLCLKVAVATTEGMNSKTAGTGGTTALIMVSLTLRHGFDSATTALHCHWAQSTGPGAHTRGSGRLAASRRSAKIGFPMELELEGFVAKCQTFHK